MDRDNASLRAALTRAKQPKWATASRPGALNASFYTTSDQPQMGSPNIEALDFRQNGVTYVPCQQQMMTMKRMNKVCMQGNA